MGGQALVEFALVIPILMLLVLAIGDFGRLYTSMIAVQAAAREAADYGAFDATHWDASAGTGRQIANTANEMISRACTAVSNLPDYTTGDGTALCASPGSNPLFTYQLEDSTGTAIANPPGACGNPSTEPPCVVHVTMSYTYHTFFDLPALPVLNFSPYPSTLAIQRDSRFAISDLAAPQ